MGRDQAGGAFVADQRLECAEHQFARCGIEVAGRLVGEDDARMVGRGAGDGHALLLAARQFCRAMRAPRPHAEEVQQFAAARVGLAARPAGDELRDRDVLERGELGEQMVELIDVADGRPAQQRAGTLREPGGWRAHDFDLACLWPFEQAAQVQQRRLARAGRCDDRDELAGLDRKVGGFEDPHQRLVLAEMPVDAGEPQMGFTHSAAPRPDRTAPRARRDRALRGN